MADTRFFAKVDVGYFSNPKVCDLMDDQPRAVVLHLAAILYCRQHLTDGSFPIRQVVRTACASYCGGQCESHCDSRESHSESHRDSRCDFCALTDAGLFEPVDNRTANVHDYLKHQEGSEDIQRRKNAGKAGAAARWAKAKGTSTNPSEGGVEKSAVAMRVVSESHSESQASRYAEERRGEESMYPVASDPSADADAADEGGSLTLIAPPAEGATFEAVYDLFAGRKKSPSKARAAWKRALARKGITPEFLIERGSAYVTAMKATGKFPEFTKYPENWLNDEMWEADLPQPTAHQRRRANPNVPEGW